MRYAKNKITLFLLSSISASWAMAMPAQVSDVDVPEAKISDVIYRDSLQGSKLLEGETSAQNLSGIVINTGIVRVDHTVDPEITTYYWSTIKGGEANNVVIQNNSRMDNVTLTGNSVVVVTADNPATEREVTGMDPASCNHGLDGDQKVTPLVTNGTYKDTSIEYLYSTTTAITATSNNSSFYNSSKQVVGNHGVSNNAHFYDDSLQYVNVGSSTNATFNGTAQQVVSWGDATNSTFNDQSAQFVLEGGTVTNSTLHDQSLQVVEAQGAALNTSLQDQSVQILQDQARAVDTKLTGQSKQFVLAGATSNGTSLGEQSFVRVAKGGELTGFTFLSGEANLAVEAGSKVGQTLVTDTATITVLNGDTTDEAAYIDSLDGSARIEFVQEAGKASTGTLEMGQLAPVTTASSNTFVMGGDTQTKETDLVKIDNAKGTHNVHWRGMDSGKEVIANPSQGQVIIQHNTGDATFNLVDANGNTVNQLDLGVYSYTLNSQMNAGGATQWAMQSTGQLSASASAALNVAAAPLQIFQNETQNLRYRMTTLKDSEQNTGVWLRAIADQTKVKQHQLDFKIKQKGVELGLDHGWRLDSGLLVAGVFANTTNNDIELARGRDTSLDSYSFGSYVSYFDDSGLYLDSVLKYNKFKNKVKADTANGVSVNGKYNTSAMGLSLEAGYHYQQANGLWYEPYARLSYAQMSSKNYQLSNAMQVDVGKQKSLIGEVGGSIGQRYDFNGASVLPYVKLAVAREFQDNNKVTLNSDYRFNQDLSGNTSKLGVGANLLLENNMNLFMEVDRQFGSKVKSPVQANLGLRYNF